MLKFKKVEAQNYKSFGNMELELENKGLVLVDGENNTNDSYESNGSGKSTLLETISYAIYGLGALNIRADEVVKRDVGKDTFVKLHFEQGGIDYRIERYRKHSEHKNKVRLYENGEDITASTDRKTDALIENIIGISIETYMNSIMYGQGNEPLFSEATDKGKKEILENITNISIYAEAQEIAKEKIKEKKIEDSEVDSQIVTQEASIENIKESVARESERYTEIGNMIEAKKKELEIAKKERKSFPQSKLRTIKNQLKGLGAPMPEFISDTRKLDKAEEALKEIQGKEQEFRQAINQIKMNIDGKTRERNNLDTSDVCPTCGGKLSNEHIKERYRVLSNEIGELQSTIRQYEEQHAKVFVPAIEAAEREYREERIELEANKQEYSETVHKRALEEQQLKGQIEIYENEKEQLMAAVERAKKGLEELEALPKPDDRVEEIEAIEKKIDKLKERKNEIFLKVNKYEDVVKAFSNSGIRSVVLDLVTPSLTNSANKYLGTLSESTLEVEFVTQVENASGELADRFDVEVLHSGEKTTFQTLSQGEKTRVNVAISLALQDLVYSNSELKTNIALYDEVFDGLDDVGVTSVIEILKEKAKEIGTVFVITHSSTMKPLFEKTITVEKMDKESRIKKEPA